MHITLAVPPWSLSLKKINAISSFFSLFGVPGDIHLAQFDLILTPFRPIFPPISNHFAGQTWPISTYFDPFYRAVTYFTNLDLFHFTKNNTKGAVAVSEEKIQQRSRRRGQFSSSPFSLPESAQTLAGITFRAAGKSGKNFSSSVEICRKTFPARNFGQPQPSRVFWATLPR